MKKGMRLAIIYRGRDNQSEVKAKVEKDSVFNNGYSILLVIFGYLL